MDGRFAIVIPLYNHAGTVRQVAEAAVALGFPVFVIDDGSTDGGADLVANLEGVTLLRHSVNQGKGVALRTGFSAAAGGAGWAITLDADGQHQPADAYRLINALPLDQRPIVVGVREGMNNPNTPWTSRVGRAFSNFWVRASGGPAVRDTQTGFRIYPLPETLQLHARSKRFAYEVEILVVAQWCGIPTVEALTPVIYPPRGERISHFHPWADFWRNFLTFTRLIALRFLIPVPLRRRLFKRREET